MRKQTFYPPNKHKFCHTCTPIVGTPQKQRQTHYVTHNYSKDNRHMLDGLRMYNKERNYTRRNEHFLFNDFNHTQNNNLTLRKTALNPHYYYKSSVNSDYYKPPVQQHTSEITLTEVSSYDEANVSYEGSLVSVASSFDTLQDRMQTRKIRQQPHHAYLYPKFDSEQRHSRTVYSLYDSDDQKKRHSDMEKAVHQRKDEKLNRRYTDEMLSGTRTKINANNSQTLSYSVYNTNINSNDKSKNKVPLMLFRKDEENGPNNSDVVYIPVVILSDKQENNCDNSKTAGSERVDNEKDFTERKFFIQHNAAKDTITENDELINDTPDMLYNNTNIMYRKVANDNLFKESKCPLLSNTSGINRMQERTRIDESLLAAKSIVRDNVKKSDDESVYNQLFPYGNCTEIDKLQSIIKNNDHDKISKNDPLNVMVAKLDKMENPFSNPKENIKTTLLSSNSRYSGVNWKVNIDQHSQSVQVSKTSIISKKDGSVQVSNIPKVTTKDGEVQVYEIPSTLIAQNGETICNKLKGEKPGVISENFILPTHLAKDSTEIKENGTNNGKENSGITKKCSNNGSEHKYREIIQEINDLVNNFSRGENKSKGTEDYNCCQRKVCKKENKNGKLISRSRQNNEIKQFAPENMSLKRQNKEVPKSLNSSFLQQESYESPFQRLFSNDYKITSRPPYFKTGMYTDSPMTLENTFKWLTEPNKQFVESISSNFRTIPKKIKNTQTAYPFFTKLKKKLSSKDKLKAEKTVDKKTAEKEDESKEVEEKQQVEEEILHEQDLEFAEKKIGKEKVSKKQEECDKKTENSKTQIEKKQIEVNLGLICDYIIQGFNLYLGKTVHTVLIDGIYTIGTVTEKLQNRN